MQLRSTCGQFQLFYASGPVWRESVPTRTVPGVDAARKFCARIRGEDVAGLTSVRALAHFVVCIGNPGMARAYDMKLTQTVSRCA